MFGNVEGVDRKPPAQVVRLLAGRIERVAVAGGIVIAKIGARLDRVCRHAVVRELKLNDFGRRSHRRLRLVAISALDLEHDVGSELLVHERRGRLHSQARRDHRWQRAVVDFHRLGGLFRGESAVGHDRGNDVADVMDVAAGEGRTGSRVHGPPVGKRHRMYHRELAMPGFGPILGCQGQQHARPHRCGLRRQRANSRMRMWAAHEGAPGGAGQNDIVDVAAFSLNEANILAAPQRLADVAALLVRLLRRHRASTGQPKMGVAPRISLLITPLPAANKSRCAVAGAKPDRAPSRRFQSR